MSADDPYSDRCHTVGELRDALEEYSDDRPLIIDHNGPEFNDVVIDDRDGSVVLR